jgi:HAD superfamily hydrolase (TIGR01509 family)
MLFRQTPIGMVIFDCDGVLIDSEKIANRVIAESLTGLGWHLTGKECQEVFLGMSLRGMIPLIETRLARAIPPDWLRALRADMLKALEAGVEPIPHAEEALHAVTALGLPWRIASNSSYEEMSVKFKRTGLAGLVAGRMHSHRDVPRSKPAPDLFLHVAAVQKVAPGDCLVIEDSVPGVQAARAAGMEVLGYAPTEVHQARLLKEGAYVFTNMRQVKALVGAALKVAA